MTLTRDYSGTNRLMNITGNEVPQYIYDYNGNVTADSVRKITGITYDYRNLPVEMNLTTNNEDRYKYKMRYKYDEAGNRTRKQMYRSRLGEENWTLYDDEVYIRDAKGNETAIYENGNLMYINIWGAGLEGKVRKDDRDNTIYSYYYKDHLGSITAVMDGASGTITQAQDYDAWGDICRTYSTTDTTVNKFIGKERDTETGYDYFGARYYDSRIGRWLQIEPLYDKYLQFSPYQYGLLNPMKLADADGNDVIVTIEGNVITFTVNIYYAKISQHSQGLTKSQIERYKQNINTAKKEWNSISEIEYNGEKYSLKFNFNFIEADNLEKMQIFNNRPEGINIALPAKNELGNPRIADGYKLIFPFIPERESLYPKHSESHELAHLMGVEHIVSNKTHEYFTSSDLMGGNFEFRFPPREQNVIKILENLDFTKQKQIIKGAIKEPDL